MTTLTAITISGLYCLLKLVSFFFLNHCMLSYQQCFETSQICTFWMKWFLNYFCWCQQSSDENISWQHFNNVNWNSSTQLTFKIFLKFTIRGLQILLISLYAKIIFFNVFVFRNEDSRLHQHLFDGRSRCGQVSAPLLHRSLGSQITVSFLFS